MVQLSPASAQHRCKVSCRGTQLTFIVALLVLHRGQPDRGESYIVVGSGPICSRVDKLLQCSLLSVSKFRIASKKRCEQGYGWVCAKFCCRMSWQLKHIRMLAAMYVSSVYFRFTTQEFSMVGDYFGEMKVAGNPVFSR